MSIVTFLAEKIKLPVPRGTGQIGKNVGCAEDIFFSLFVARINDSSGQSAARNGANSGCSCLGD